MEAPSARLRLRVVPGAGGAGVVGRHGDAWKIRVAAPAERGRANDAVVRLLAETLSLPRRSITLVSGHAGRDKMVRLGGITQGELERRLASAERKDTR
ncbi:MAG: DUF167 domain-containing protein [Gaiellaceae bacterium]